ncbi:MAG: squalene synthase HpnC [Gammaproteobacteria bacterium]|nr:squalene synthase HpnC [Gammaproteobacteria bacterium]
MTTLKESYNHCRQFAARHYENFPVASLLLPASIRPAVAVLYTFARTADDIADEGELSSKERLAGLDNLQNSLDAILFGRPTTDPVFNALSDVIERYRIPHRHFNDLLDAFRQDVTKDRYQNEEELLDYCSRSANPIGQSMLALVGESSAVQLKRSDAICTALQLVNFLQDISQDYHEMGRIYLPLDEMQRFGIREEQIASGTTTPELKALINYQLDRIEKLLDSGADLGKELSGRFGLEIRMVIVAAYRMVAKLRAQEDCFSRPRISRFEKISILFQALKR